MSKEEITDQWQSMLSLSNVFAGVPASIPEELFQTLAESQHVSIERIVSHGHRSPRDFWYDQDQNEWVLLLQGAATVRFENEVVEMKPGDFILIPAHQRHRVDWTTPDEPTVWLAVFYA